MCSFASFSHWCFFYPFNTRKDQSHPTSSDGFEGERKVHDGHFSPEPTLEQRIKTEMNWGSYYIGELLFHRLKFLGHLSNSGLFSSPVLKAQLSFSDPLLSFVCLSVHLTVNFSHFHFLLKNYGSNFNQTCHKASLGEGNSSLLK